MHVQQNFFEEYTLLNLKEVLDDHVWVEKVVSFSGKKNFVIYTFFLALSPSPSEFQWDFLVTSVCMAFFPALTGTSLFVILKRS